MATVEGLKKVQERLRAAGQAAATTSVVVGYTQSYAIYVHEDLEAHHKVGQAKYLEAPARTMGKELGAKVRELLAQGKSLKVALLAVGLMLQRASQELVPVRYGDLKRSAFTRLEEK